MLRASSSSSGFHSWRSLTSLLLSGILLPVCAQQITTFAIQDINIPFDRESTAGEQEVYTWSILGEFEGVPENVKMEAFSNVDLIAGANDTNNNNIVQAFAVNRTNTFSFRTGTGNAAFEFPPNLPLGIYHLRVNTSLVAVTETFDEATLTRSRSVGPVLRTDTKRSATFKLVESRNKDHAFCKDGPRATGQYPNTTSPFTDPTWTSFILEGPFMGEDITTSALDSGLPIGWDWRNGGNNNNALVTNFTFQIQNARDGSNVGPPFDMSADIENGFGGLLLSRHLPLTSEGRNLSPGNSYRIVTTYRNALADGVRAPGELTKYESPAFNVINQGDTCATAGNFNSGGGGGGGSGNNPSGQNGGDRIHASMIALSTIFIAVFYVL